MQSHLVVQHMEVLNYLERSSLSSLMANMKELIMHTIHHHKILLENSDCLKITNCLILEKTLLTISHSTLLSHLQRER